MAKKVFVLQTSVLTSSADSTLRFGSDAEIVIPLDIIRELGDCANAFTAKGQVARRVLDYLDSFNMRALKSPEGVRQKNNSILRIEDGFRDVQISLSIDLRHTDLRCFQISLGLKQKNASVVLVTKNPQTRLMAEFIGIKAQPFRDDLFPALEEQYTGRVEVTTSSLKLNIFFSHGSMDVKDIYHYTSIEWMPNLFLQIKAVDSNASALARYDGNKNKIVKLKFGEFHPFGITPKNAGQYMLMEALLEPPETAPIVIAKGGAGTGKTFNSMAVALEKTIESDPIYSQILITAPVQTVGGEKIGFLPGEIEDKFNPHIGGIKDNIRILLNSEEKKSRKNTKTENGQYLFEHGYIQVQPIGFLRGRTIVDTIFIIDETQNIEPEDIKSIVTRAATGSKFIFLGDPTQIDNPNLNERYNGLVYLSEKMKDSPLAWQVALNEHESVRSELARYAAKIL